MTVFFHDVDLLCSPQ